jgi:hypothetical protein
MKTALALLVLVASISFGHAGGFGGPPPFTNGSPLVTGVDGSYQASARATNITGVFRFTYSGGSQTSGTITLSNGVLRDPYNDYVFFVEGLVFRGLVQANINSDNLTGVLDEGGVNAPNGIGAGATAGSTVGPPLGITALMTGFFTGEFDQSSPDYFFKGKGDLQITNTSSTTISIGPIQSFRFTGIRNAQPVATGT